MEVELDVAAGQDEILRLNWALAAYAECVSKAGALGEPR